MESDSEFDVIARYFNRPAPPEMLGVGDDCALLPVSHGFQIAVSTDMLVQGEHFFPDVDPAHLGHKALAVNLSDLAAMGARPLACTLALSLPAIDHAWLKAFSDGFHALAKQTHCPLVGGDTTHNPAGVVISVTVMGEVRRTHALRRNAAKVGDDIWVSGVLGAPDIALRLLQGRLPSNPELLAATRQALEQPMPRWRFGQHLVGVARAALDISDGLLQDLNHILTASHCAAQIQFDALPMAPALAGLAPELQQAAMLAGGDVYELCFTAAPVRREQVQAVARQYAVPVSRIGSLVQGEGLRVVGPDGVDMDVLSYGFDHFKHGITL
ncbi:thiamine-phosphate kinase [Alcaligenaceae bacterium CGII-47]|nr:thiamine-phosphate kinase [Alcaligenaceae bacterium CGII-47]